MIIESPLDVAVSELFLRLPGLRPEADVFLKLEGLNLSGSIKLKPARAMIEDCESRGLITPGTSRIIESSSGSLGVALSQVCRYKGYSFTCVTDPNISPSSVSLMRAYGAEVVVVDQLDHHSGYLGTRLEYIKTCMQSDPRYFWPNQYSNSSNPEAHYRSTAREIHSQVPDLDFLFVGAGTTGTLSGCARYFAEHSPRTRIVAVDTEGSITFGGPPGRRRIPGLGTSQRPAIASTWNVSDVVLVPESRTVEMCHRVLDRYGILVGGSTGTVLAALESYTGEIAAGSTVVAVSPDFCDRSLTTIYDPAWVAENITVDTKDPHAMSVPTPQVAA